MLVLADPYEGIGRIGGGVLVLADPYEGIGGVLVLAGPTQVPMFALEQFVPGQQDLVDANFPQLLPGGKHDEETGAGVVEGIVPVGS